MKTAMNILGIVIVSAADGYSTIYGMLDGKYQNQTISAYYKAYPKTQPFGLEVWYGVAKEVLKRTTCYSALP